MTDDLPYKYNDLPFLYSRNLYRDLFLMPLLTVCIPSYNYRQYLPYAIESCLASPADFRLVVLDNASTDGTDELRSRYEGDPRVTWHRNRELLPIQDNWNKAVSLATTPWVKVLQADDFLLPGAIERLLEIIASRPTAWFHGHLCRVVDGEGR